MTWYQEVGATVYIPPIVRANVSTKAWQPHRLLLIIIPSKDGHNPSLTTERLPPEVFLWEGFICPKTRCARPDETIHSASVTGIPFRSKHSVARKVAISFAYIQCRALAVEIVVLTCKTRKLIYLTLFML